MAIEDTLKNHPGNFPFLNSGITIVTEDIKFDNKKENEILLKNPSIINGSQTRGVISDFIKNNQDDDPFEKRNVQYEIIVTNDYDLVSDISIARNTQIRVEKISILGARAIFDELENQVKKDYKDKKNKSISLRKSETDRSDNFLPTEKLLQIIAVLVPEQLWEQAGNKECHKSKYYARSSRSLALYQKIYESKDDKTKELYRFYLDIAFDAWELYEKWSKHEGWAGTNIRNGIERDEKSNILKIYDGLIFPAIAAHSVFIKKTANGRWSLCEVPDELDKELVATSKKAFIDIASSKVEAMGKSQSCYEWLYDKAKTIQNFINRS